MCTPKKTAHLGVPVASGVGDGDELHEIGAQALGDLSELALAGVLVAQDVTDVVHDLLQRLHITKQAGDTSQALSIDGWRPLPGRSGSTGRLISARPVGEERISSA